MWTTLNLTRNLGIQCKNIHGLKHVGKQQVVDVDAKQRTDKASNQLWTREANQKLYCTLYGRGFVALCSQREPVEPVLRCVVAQWTILMVTAHFYVRHLNNVASVLIYYDKNLYTHTCKPNLFAGLLHCWLPGRINGWLSVKLLLNGIQRICWFNC